MPNVLRQAGPHPYWYVRYRVRVLDQKTKKFKREEKWHRLGYCDEMTKRQAERDRDQIVAQVNNQVFTAQSQILLADFARIYEAKHMTTLALGPRKKYESLLKNHILPEFGGRRMCDLGNEAVQAFLNRTRDAGLSWWTRNDIKAIISGLYTKASDWHYWSGKNPTSRTTLGPRRIARKKYGLTDEQIVTLINSLSGSVQLAVATAVSTAMRASELSGLKWGSVDLQDGKVYVQESFYRGEVGETKTPESHRSLSLGLLLPIFRRVKPSNASPDDYVFQIGGKPLDDRSVLRQFIRPAAKALGFHFPGFGWRTFRRLNLTAIQGPGGVNVFEAMAQAGHTKPETTMKYTLTDASHREDAVREVQRRWLPEELCGNSAGMQ
jgi:integrase